MNKILLLVIVALFSFVDINSQNIVITTQKESSVPIIDDIPIIKADTFYCLRIPVDTRSLIPVISVHSISNLQYRWQS